MAATCVVHVEGGGGGGDGGGGGGGRHPGSHYWD